MSMRESSACIQWLDFEPGRRILVISDIHGNLEYLNGVLALAAYSPEDELIIDGDFLEKGPACLATLRRIMSMSRQGRVHPVRGNCDGWHTVFDNDRRGNEHLLRYLRWKGNGFLWELFSSLGVDIQTVPSLSPYIPLLHSYDEEFDFSPLPARRHRQRELHLRPRRQVPRQAPSSPQQGRAQPHRPLYGTGGQLRQMDCGGATTRWCSTGRTRSAPTPS